MPELQTEGTDNRRRAPSAAGTIGLVVVISAVFGLQMLWTGAPVIGGRGRTLEVLIAMGAGIGREAVLHGEWWRLFSPMLLHGSLGHVASNLMAIYFTGTMLEMFLGWRRLVVLFVVSGAGGCLASLLREDAVVAIGASGAGWGFMVAAMVLSFVGMRPRPDGGHQQLRSGLLRALIINMIISFLPGIDARAHFGGGITGGIVMLLWLVAVTKGSIRDGAAQLYWTIGSRAQTIGAVAAIGLLLAALAAGLRAGHPWAL